MEIRKEFNHKHSRTFLVLYGDLSSRRQSWANPKDEKTKWNSSLWSCKWKWIRYFQTSSCQRQFRGVFIVMTQTMESGHPPIQTQKLTSFWKKTRYEMGFSIFFRRMSLEELRNRHTDPSSHPRCVSCFWNSQSLPMLPSKKKQDLRFHRSNNLEQPIYASIL